MSLVFRRIRNNDVGRTDALSRAPTRLVLILVGSVLLTQMGLPTFANSQTETSLSGYLLNVGVANNDGPFNRGSVSDLQRIRLMGELATEDIRFDVAYEHLFSYFNRPEANTGLGGTNRGGTGLWLGLQGRVTSGDHFSWTHKIDRLSATFLGSRSFEISVGRQSISWATTLIFTPADPFVPFDPQDPFREFRAGVDAIRLKVFPGSLSELDIVLRLTDDLFSGTSTTALGRFKSVVGGWEVGGWAGILFDDAVAALSLTGDFVGTSLRSEFQVRDIAGQTFGRWSIGFDRNFLIGDNDLFAILEYQYDGFGASGSDQFVPTIATPMFRRGELQVLAEHAGALQVSYQPHPLLSLGMLTMASLSDGSVLFVPSIGYSAGSELSLSAGAFMGVGSETTPLGLPDSEFGAAPTTLYVSASTFF